MESRSDNLHESKRRKIKDSDKGYFDSYAHIEIHEQMLKDTNRTLAYKDAILKNEADFKGKTVLDVGAGTSILSIFCALAGAKKVYAVEASGMAEQAKKIVEANKLSDKIVILNKKMEELTEEDIPEKVDVIVSEWMGYFLVYESMFSSVIYARDKWLKEDGKMYPSKANMYFVPVTDEEWYNGKVNYWKDIYGIDFSAIIPFAKECAFNDAVVDTLPAQNQLSFPVKMKEIDCKKVSLQEIQETKFDFSFKAIYSDSLYGYISWFDVDFEGANTKVVLSTAPEKGYTHWQQTLFYLENPIPVTQDTIIAGSIHVKENQDNNRLLEINIETKVADHPSISKLYHMR